MGLFDKIKQSYQTLGILPSDTPDEEKMDFYEHKPTPAPAPAPAQDKEGLYNPHLEKLIDLALADGELTEKEKQVLFKKAECMGIDLDEFEMVLEARLYERNNATSTQAVSNASPKSNKFGDIKKCPACGAIVQSFTARCVECGFEFNVSETTQSIERLFDILNAVEAESREDATGFFSSLSQTMGQQMSGDGGKTIRRKKSIIQNFPVPTSKNDILEFLTLAVPQAKYKTFMGMPVNDPSNPEKFYLGPVWKAKCEQIIMKAKIALRDDKETLDIIQQYAEELKVKF